MALAKSLAGTFASSYAGYGRYGKAAALAAAGLGLAAPLAISNDDRGYLKSSLITSPLLAAGFVAAPGLYENARSTYTDFGQFWKNKPFDVNFSDWRQPFKWKDWSEAGALIDRSPANVQTWLHNEMSQYGRDTLASIKPKPYNTSLYSKRILGKLDVWERAASKLTTPGSSLSPEKLAAKQAKAYSRQALLSAAVKEATEAGLMPDDLLSGMPPSKAIPLLSYDQIRQAVQHNADNPEFVRTMYRRTRGAENLNISQQITSLPHLKSNRGITKVSLGEALLNLEKDGAGGRPIQWIKQAQQAIERGYIHNATAVYETTNGVRGSVPLGLDIFNKYDKSFQLPFTRQDSTLVRMNQNWNQVGTSRQVWDAEALHDPTDLILSKLEQGVTMPDSRGRPQDAWKTAKGSISQVFQWGGITDRGDAQDVAMHYESANVSMPEAARRANAMTVAPSPYGVKDGKRIEDLPYDEANSVMEAAMKKYKLTTMRDPSKGVLQRLEAEGVATAGMPAMGRPDHNWRWATKAMGIDPKTVPAKLRVEELPSDWWNRLGIGNADEMRLVKAEMVRVSPQAQTLFASLPAKAEQSVLDAYKKNASDTVENAYETWKARQVRNWANQEQSAQIVDNMSRKRASEKANRALYRRRTKAEWEGLRDLADVPLGDEDYQRLWRTTDTYKQVISRQSRRLQQANAWWDTEAGTQYRNFSLDYLKQQGLSPQDAEAAFGKIQASLMEDPRRVLGFRRLQTLGETSLNLSEDFAGVEAELSRVVHVNTLSEGITAGVVADSKTVVGTDKGPVTLRNGTHIDEIVPSPAGGADLYVTEHFGLGGGKGDWGEKGLTHVVKNQFGADLTRQQIEAHNLVAETTGIGDILPESFNTVGQALYAGHKSSTPIEEMLNICQNISVNLVKNKYTETSQARAQQFIEALQNNQFRGFTELDSVISGWSKEQKAVRHNKLMYLMNDYLNDLGGMAGEIDDPVFQAYSRTSARRPGMKFSEYTSRNIRYPKMAIWDHTLLNQQREAKFTYDMMGEMSRLGHRAGLEDILGKVRLPNGDPKQVGQFMQYMARSDFASESAQLETRVGLGDVLTGESINKLDARQGPRSVFNPGAELGQKNVSIDLGFTLHDVEIAGTKQDVKFLSKLGADAVKPNKYGTEWASFELEHKLQKAMDTAEAIRGVEKPEEAMKKALKVQVADYYNTLYSALAGKDIRPTMIHPDALTGWSAERSTGLIEAGEKLQNDPFTIRISKAQLRHLEDPELLKAFGKGGRGYAYGSVFRNPVSAHVYAKFVLDDGTGHLDPNEWGMSSRVRSWLQMDHDKDPMIAMMHAPGSKAEVEALESITNQTSSQWRTLQATELLQAMENPANITDKIYQAELAKDAWVGEGSVVEKLESALRADEGLDLAARESRSFRERMTFAFTGQYSNQTTRMQLMLEDNPFLKNTNADYTFLDKMMYYVRQVAISSSKGKIKLKPGETPQTMMAQLNRAINMGPEGAGLMQKTFVDMSEQMGFTGIYNQTAQDLIGEVTKANGTKVELGETFNVMSAWAGSGRGREAIEKFLSSPNNARASRLATFLTRNTDYVQPEDAKRMLQQLEGANANISGGLFGLRRERSGAVKIAERVFGESGGRMAEETSRTIGALNDALKEVGGGAMKSIRPAFKVLGAGAAVAALGGLMTASVRSSNARRPEETIAAPDHVPGEAIAGSRSSVDPKRNRLPAEQGVRTAVVAKVNRSVDLDVRARSENRSDSAEIEKTVRKMAAGPGYTTVNVNRSGGWRDRVSKPMLRRKIQEELDRGNA